VLLLVVVGGALLVVVGGACTAVGAHLAGDTKEQFSLDDPAA